MPEAPRWFKRKDIVPSEPPKDKDYPRVIYQFEGDSPLYRDLIYASYSAMVSNGFELAIVDESQGKTPYRLTVRSKSEERATRTESALFLGAVEATKLKMIPEIDVSDDLNVVSLTQDQGQQAQAISTTLVRELVSKEDLYKAFQEYYGGLRWGSDQERLTNALYVHGTDLDFDFLDDQIHAGNLESLVYRLDNVDISYEERRGWREKGVAWILNTYPALDYRRLKDDAFRQTEEGRTLEKAYAELCGEVLAWQHKSTDPIISKDGRLLPKPPVPLSRHPIFEALMIDEVALDRPKQKYDMGPSDLTGLILDSDSRIAHQALVQAINTRVPEQHRRVFDGPNEFEHKHRLVIDVLRDYRNSVPGTISHDLLKEDVLGILDAYTGQGDIAIETREEALRLIARGDKYLGDIYNIPQIVGDILQISIASPDIELLSKAEELILYYIPTNESQIAVSDPLAVKRSDLMAVIIDSLQWTNEFSSPEFLWRVSQRVFGNEVTADKIAQIVEISVQSGEIRHKPKALLALKHLKSFPSSFSDDKNPKEIEAQRAFDKEISFAKELEEKESQLKNRLILQFIEEIANIEPTSRTNETNVLFESFVKRLKIRGYKMESLPEEYNELVRIALESPLSDTQRNRVLWHLAQELEYVHSQSEHLLVPVVLDMYKIALGELGEVRVPSREDKYAFGAIRHFVGKHGRGIFKSATQEQLQLLEAYFGEIRTQAEQIANNAFLGESMPDGKSHDQWRKEQMEILVDLAKDMGSIQEVYQEYLRVEAVKVLPHEYYPWMIEKLVPFWQKMNWEVGPGNAPSGDIRRLFRSLETFVQHVIELQNELNVKEKGYPEDFDCFIQGELDTFLKQMYEQMVVPHDIKYNGTVWREGLGFMHSAASYMPEVLIKQIEDKYPGSAFAKYIRGSREESKKYE